MFVIYGMFVFFKQKTAYEMRISDWSSDVCSSDLLGPVFGVSGATTRLADASASLDLTGKWTLSASIRQGWTDPRATGGLVTGGDIRTRGLAVDLSGYDVLAAGDSFGLRVSQPLRVEGGGLKRSEEHTSELQSLMRISYAVFCLQKKKT